MTNNNYSINVKDAFNILGISSDNVTPEDIKQAYRIAAKKYHPDRNPSGFEMMKMVNIAYDVLKDFDGEVPADGRVNYGESVNVALNAIIELGLNIDVCGSWVWVTGDTKAYKDILKENGFKWAYKKSAWYFRPEHYKPRPHKAWSMGRIRSVYGSQSVNIYDDEQQVSSDNYNYLQMTIIFPS